jgi:hypothetical protein
MNKPVETAIGVYESDPPITASDDPTFWLLE